MIYSISIWSIFEPICWLLQLATARERWRLEIGEVVQDTISGYRGWAAARGWPDTNQTNKPFCNWQNKVENSWDNKGSLIDSCSSYPCLISLKMELSWTKSHVSVGFWILVHLFFSILSKMSLGHLCLEFAVNWNLRSSLDNFWHHKRCPEDA